MNIIDRINNLAQKFGSTSYFNEQAIFKQWNNEATRALLINDLAKHDGMAGLIKGLAKEVEEIDELLVNADSKRLPDAQRDRLIDMKRMYQHFLAYFTDAEKTEARLTKEVEANEKLNATR